MKRPALAVTALALAVPLAVAAQARPASRPDLAGVWQLEEGQSTTFANTTPGRAEAPPLTPQAAALLDSRRAGRSADPTLQCMPMGFPRNMMTRLPIEIVQSRRQVVLLFATGLRARRVYTDGRKHDDDIDPSFNGESIGRWQGDTLVVDTRGFKDTWLDSDGAPHSEALHVVERIRRLAGGHELEDRITVEDPVMLSRPWSTRKLYRAMPGLKLIDYTCQEHARQNPRWASTGRLGDPEQPAPAP
jgi:hypothetical protein